MAVAFLHRTAGKPIIDRKADWRSTWGIRWAAPLRPRPARRCVHAAFPDFITGRDGVYLIGEAAGFISASSFEGISSAIRSGSALAEAMSQADDDRELARFYRRKTTSLRLKLWLKTIKRWFMYTPWVRHIIMRLGLAAIHVEQENK